MNFKWFVETSASSNRFKAVFGDCSINVSCLLFQFVAVLFLSLATSHAQTSPSAPAWLITTGSTGAVGLTWNATSGATSYNVLRSGTSGGGYTPVANGVIGTVYTDTGLANGSTYYYVVAAASASGTSGYSNEASATTNTIVGAWSCGTGLFSGITLGALQNTSVVNQAWPAVVNYSLNLNSWPFDVYVPANYDGSKPYGVVVYITSDPSTGVVLQTASADKNLIWIAPRNVGNGANSPDRYGAGIMAIYRAKELFNIDARRVYSSGKSGGARTASALAFYHSELFRGTTPSSGYALPRLNAVSPDYIPNTSGQSDTYFDYADSPFSYYYYNNNALHNSIDATAKANKLRSYIITRYGDYREDYFVEGFHCAYEPQGETCFLYDGPGTHQDATDAEMEEAIGYLDRNDVFPVNANITAGANGFAGMTNISQSGATAASATTSGSTTYTLIPTLTAVAAAKTGSSFYWDNTNGSTVRWLWEVQNAAPTNQKTCFGFWFTNETWGGGAPVSVTSGTNPSIVITITQNGSQNRLVVSARPDSGGETIFYDGYFSFVPAYSTAWTSTQTGYLTGTGSPVELRMDLNQNRWQLTFNGIALNSTNSIANGTQIGDDNRLVFGYWDSALGFSFWKHDSTTSAYNTWSPFTKSIFTAATGALSGTGAAPSPMGLRYVIASDPNLPDPPAAGPTGLTTVASGGAVNLTWNALAGASSYQVKRALASGGPYTTIQIGLSGTTYSDSIVVSGSLYYYTVSAVTASGTTANAPQVCAGLNLPPDLFIGKGTDGYWQTAANWTTLPVAGDTLSFAGLRLSSTNNYTANTQFGGLVFNSGAGASTLNGNAITLNGNIANNSSNTQTISLPLTLSSGSHSLAANTSGILSIGGVISGNGSLTKSGTGTVTLAGINTYGGGTTVDTGTLTLAAGGGSGAIRGAVTINSGATLKTTVTDAVGYNVGTQISTLNVTGGTFDNGINANQGYRTNVALTGGTMTSTGGGTFNFTVGYGISSSANSATSTITSGIVVRDNNNMTINVADGPAVTDLLISGVISGAGGSITQTGGGTLTLTAGNTFTGNITINGGTLTTGLGIADPGTNTSQASGLGDIGTSVSRAITVNNGGVLSLTGGNVFGTGGSTNTLGTTTLVVNQGGVFQTGLNGSGSGWWNKLGPVTLNGGTIHVGSGANTTNFQGLALIGTVTIGGSTASIIDNYAGSNNAANGIHLGQNSTTNQSIVFNVADVTGDSATDLTVSTKLINTSAGLIASGLTKTGAGTMTLTAASTYTGPTTITGGVLNVTGTLSGGGGVAVNSGATLAGTGCISGTTTVSSGGIIAPGLSGTSGTVTLSTLALNDGAILNVDLAGTSNSDKIATSVVSASGTTTVNLNALAGFAGAGSYPIISGTGAISASNFAIGTLPVAYGGTLSVTSGTLSVVLFVNSAPPAPTGLTATAGNAAVALSWAAAPAASSYSVKRSGTSGSGYVTIASGLTGTSYTDTALTNGTTYYYVVSAVNAIGESANASQASATPTNMPVITSAASATGTNGSSFSYTITASNSPASYGATGLPAGLSVNTNTGVISGTLSGAGTTNVTISATNPNGTGTAILTITILPSAPVITSAASATGTNGSAFNYQITASSSPTSYGATGLPAGLSVNTSTGVISGTPSVTGTTTVTISASNAGGTGSANLTIVLQPAIPSAPASLVATSSNGVVSLTWNASTGATSYNLKRSGTSGNGYTLISSQTALSYNDTAVTNGTTYYYVVSAVNSTGEGANSSEVRATPDSNSLITFLRFDENSGTVAADATGHGWNGTLVNGAGRSAGKINNAVSLTSASSQYVTLPSGVTKGVTDCTIMAWVKLTTVSNWMRIFDFGTGTSNYMFLSPQNGNNSKVRFAITNSGNGNEQRIDGTSGVPTGVWTHVAVTISGSTGILYVNGIATGTNSAMTLNPSSLGNTTQNYIGKSQFADPYLNGLVDQFQIYSRALSASEMAALANPLSAPGSVIATSGNAAANLRWQAVSGATGYSVSRSLTSGSGYATVAAAVSGTSYADTGLTNGTTYYYVITTLNGLSESPFSAEVVSTPDGTPPIINIPANITTQPTSANGAVVNFTTSATDAVSGPCITTNTPPAGSVFPIGTTTVTTTASDQSGNSASATFTVTVQSLPVSLAEQQISSTISLSATAGTLAFKTSVPGHGYQLQYCDDLAAGGWLNYGPAQAGNAADLHFDLPVDPMKTRRFYRIQITRY